jgi:hypothetical protein
LDSLFYFDRSSGGAGFSDFLKGAVKEKVENINA